MNPMNAKNTKPKQRLMRKATIVLCLVILPFNILSLILGVLMLNNIQETYSKSVTATLNSYTETLDQRMENINYLLYDLTTNDTSFTQLFLNYNNWHYDLHIYNVLYRMENAMQLSSSADAIFLYVTEKEDLLFNQYFHTANGHTSIHVAKDDLITFINDPSITTGKWYNMSAKNNEYLIRIIPDDAYYVGAYINLSDILEKLSNDLELDASDIFISSEPEASKPGHIACSSILIGDNMYLHCLIPIEKVFSSISFWFIGVLILLFLSLLIVPIFVMLFRKQINKPLSYLQVSFQELEQGNEDYRIEDMNYSKEFADTFSSFNVMAEKTADLHKKALEEEQQHHALALNNLNLKLDNLQLQIRPHFLQNMMNLLYTLVQNHREDNAKRLILYLSKYFRYMFRYGKELELFEKEMDLVKEYLTISEMHYLNAFTVSYQLDPIIGLMRFPPLLLHNFVENIIQHALIPGQTIHIVIYGDYDDDRQLVTLQISDDGRGMPDYFVEMINKNDFSSVPTGKHIGIRNSINRLAHYYDGKATVSVESMENSGTTVTIEIPQNLTLEEV